MKNRSEAIDILIVDDRQDGLIALEAILDDPRYNIVKADSGHEALRLLPYHDFAVILLDVQMPGIDGFETAECIKRLDRYKHIPIIFVTAINKDERYIFRGYETGAVDYVFKPFEAQILRSKVAVFVDLFMQSRTIRQQEAQLAEAERTERIRQLAELELEALRRYRSLADAIPHIVIRTRADGVPEYFNGVWTSYTGMAVEASIGEGWQKALHPDDLPKLLRSWLDALISGGSFESESRFQAKDGTYRWHLIRAVPEKRPTGEISAWIATATDIDDRKQVEAELRRAKEEAESASSAKTQFLANMSHEIRTPLSAILGFSELLMSPLQTAEERSEHVSTIRRNGEQLLHLINEILDISRVESGRVEVEKLEIPMGALLSEMKSIFGLKASEKGLLFSIECGADIPKDVWTDPVRLRQILWNVIGNAMKFTDRGGVCVAVEFQRFDGDTKAGQLRVRVKDTGVGVPPDRVDRLFQPFMQADSSTTRRFGGSGLGLALSKKLAQSLSGDVTLLSSGGDGSEFEILVGCEHSDETLEAHGKWGESEARKSTKKEVSLEALLGGRRILVIDDAPDNQVLISRFLRMAGATVDVAGNGLEGVEKVATGVYELVLMDIQMPVMDGYTAVRKLREQGVALPIIALTAHAMNAERVRCLDAGFDDHLSKPVDKTKLVEACTEWLAKSEANVGALTKESSPCYSTSLH